MTSSQNAPGVADTAPSEALAETPAPKPAPDSTPKVDATEALTRVLTKYLSLEEAAIPEAQRALIPYADDPAKRLEWIAEAKKPGGFFAQPAAPTPKKPATTGPASNGPNKQPAQLTAFEQYEQLRSKAPGMAAQLYQRNERAIEASRPGKEK